MIGDRRTLFLGLCMAALLPARSVAQILTGTVKDSGRAAPLAGVIVVLLDSTGQAVARSLTDENGAYRLVGRQSGSHTVQTLRIGYRPAQFGSIRLSAEHTVQRDFLVPAIRVALDTVRVRGRSRCSNASAGAAYSLWEQVRAALTASLLTQRQRSLYARALRQQLRYDASRSRIFSQYSQVLAGTVVNPWSAPPPDSLLAHGFVVDAPDGSTTYYAPDLDLLLSSRFIIEHCIRLVPSRDDATIGVGFEPVRRSDRVGIKGTFWVDRRSAELRRVDFSYSGIASIQAKAGAGGFLDFVRLVNGAWLISAWSINMPVLQRTITSDNALRGGTTAVETSVREVHVAEGRLVLVHQKGDTLWASGRRNLRGVVRDTSSRAVADAMLTLGDSRTTRSAADGTFAFDSLIPGDYRLQVHTQDLAEVGLPAADTTVVVLSKDLVLDLVITPRSRALQSLCSVGDLAAGDGIVSGTVVRRDGTYVAAARVEVTWTEWRIVSGMLMPERRRADAVTADAGTFHICGIPTSLNLVVTVRHGGQRLSLPARISGDSLRTDVTLVVAP